MKKLIIITSLLLAACGSNNSNSMPEASLDDQLRAQIQSNNLTGRPEAGRSLPSIQEPMAQLGMKLFYSQKLAASSEDVACVSCHHPMLGGGDGMSLPIGVDAVQADLLGQGRLHKTEGEGFDGGPTVPRNAPTTFNIGLWQRTLFHDGRLQRLADETIRTPDAAFGETDINLPMGITLANAQARFPVTSNEEMRGFDSPAAEDRQGVRARLAQRLQDDADWLNEFQTVLPKSGADGYRIEYNDIAQALAAYENSQVFTQNPWRRYIEGDTSALSESAKRGAVLFYTPYDEGGAYCVACHQGDFFTDEGFHNIAAPQIGRGKGNTNGTTTTQDFGRFRETLDEADKFAFRTPSLLNVEVTGPWTHAGAFFTLKDVIRHHLNPEASAMNYTRTDSYTFITNEQMNDVAVNTQQAVQQLLANREAGIPSIRDVVLSEQEIADIEAFLRSLTDPCVKDRDCLSPWIPASGGAAYLRQLDGIDRNGNNL